MCVRAYGWNEGGPVESAPQPPHSKAIVDLALANLCDENLSDGGR